MALIVRTARRKTWTSDSRRRGDGDKRSGFKTTLGSRYRYTERLIEIGDPLHAIGFLRSHDAAQGLTEAEELRALLAEWKRDQRGLIERFDSDGDREISAEEWDQAREQALEQVRRERADEPHLPRVPVLGHPQDQRPFSPCRRRTGQPYPALAVCRIRQRRRLRRQYRSSRLAFRTTLWHLK